MGSADQCFFLNFCVLNFPNFFEKTRNCNTFSDCVWFDVFCVKKHCCCYGENRRTHLSLSHQCYGCHYALFQSAETCNIASHGPRGLHDLDFRGSNNNLHFVHLQIIGTRVRIVFVLSYLVQLPQHVFSRSFSFFCHFSTGFQRVLYHFIQTLSSRQPLHCKRQTMYTGEPVAFRIRKATSCWIHSGANCTPNIFLVDSSTRFVKSAQRALRISRFSLEGEEPN